MRVGEHDVVLGDQLVAQAAVAHVDVEALVDELPHDDPSRAKLRAGELLSTFCAEIAKLRVSTLDGEILPLATGFATTELRATNRWRNVVTPLGLEPRH